MVRAAALINHSSSPSTSEVGLNFPPHCPAAAHGSYRLVPPTGTKGGHWYRFLPKTGTNGLCFPPFRLLKMNIGPGSWHQPVPMPTFRTGLLHKPGPTLWLYNPPPLSPSFPSRHLQEQLKTTPTTTPTPSGCRISPPPSPTTSLLRPPPTPPPTPPPRFLHTDAAAPRRRASSTHAPPRPARPFLHRRRRLLHDADRAPLRRLSPTGEYSSPPAAN